MPPTATATPVRDAVTVPGTTELEFTAGGTGNRKLDVVVLYSVLDNAAVRITQGASHMRTIGPRSAVVKQALGFGWTDNPTPAAFRVKATVMEDGKAWAECTWNLQVQSGATQQVLSAMETMKLDAPFTPLPDEDEMATLTAKAERRASRKKAAKKAARKSKVAAKKAPAKKAATKKKATGKKTTAKKSVAKKAATRKAATKRGAGAKRTGVKKATTKKRPAAKKKSARR
jgi:hypothetical protein